MEAIFKKSESGIHFAMCATEWHVAVTNYKGMENISFWDWEAGNVFSEDCTKEEFCNAYNEVFYRLNKKVMQ